MTEEEFWASIEKKDSGCWEWTRAKCPTGYGAANCHGEHLAHRVAWMLTNGSIPKGMQICHHCDNRPCCNPDHLFLGTARDNALDMVAKGRHHETLYPRPRPAPGPLVSARNGNRTWKLTDVEVAEIRAKYVPKVYSLRMLAQEYGIVVSMVSMIVNGKRRGSDMIGELELQP